MHDEPASSYYAARAAAVPHWPGWQGQGEAQVAIVGGGFAGLHAALSLAERGVDDVVLLEREDIGFGASGRNGGFVFGGFSLDEAALLARVGPDRARRLFALTTAAVNRIRSLVATHAIDCDLVDAGVIWANWFRDPAPLRRRQQLLAESFGVELDWLDEAALRARVVSPRYHAGLFERNAMHLDPLAFARGLARAAAARGVRIHEHSGVSGLEREGSHWRLRMPGGSLRAGQVILACGGYRTPLRRRIDRAVLPIATFVAVTEPLGERLAACLATQAAVYDTRFAFDYYHPLPDRRLLWGGRISIRDRPPRAVQELLRRDLLRVFPALAGVRIEYAWSGLMSYARHQMPQIGRGEGADTGLWWAQGFGGHGLAPTCAAGGLLAEALAEGGERWRLFADFGLADVHGRLGLAAAQCGYWWREARDAWKTRWETWTK